MYGHTAPVLFPLYDQRQDVGAVLWVVGVFTVNIPLLMIRRASWSRRFTVPHGYRRGGCHLLEAATMDVVQDGDTSIALG